jgi:hypothetical protein
VWIEPSNSVEPTPRVLARSAAWCPTKPKVLHAGRRGGATLCYDAHKACVPFLVMAVSQEELPSNCMV